MNVSTAKRHAEQRVARATGNGSRRLFGYASLAAPSGKVSETFFVPVWERHDEFPRHCRSVGVRNIRRRRWLSRSPHTQTVVMGQRASQNLPKRLILNTTLNTPRTQAVDQFFATVRMRDDIGLCASHAEIDSNSSLSSRPLRDVLWRFWRSWLGRNFLAWMRFGVGDSLVTCSRALLWRHEATSISICNGPNIEPIPPIIGSVEVKPCLLSLNQARRVINNFQHDPLKGELAVFVPCALEQARRVLVTSQRRIVVLPAVFDVPGTADVDLVRWLAANEIHAAFWSYTSHVNRSFKRLACSRVFLAPRELLYDCNAIKQKKQITATAAERVT